jgi:hypothetical protein
LIFGLPQGEKEEPMKVRARELAIMPKTEMNFWHRVSRRRIKSHFTIPPMTGSISDFWLKILPKNLVLELRWNKLVSVREAARLGGIGSCGRELCCLPGWLTLEVWILQHRYQQLSLNPQTKGMELKCCLNYELDTYMDALKGFPDLKQN